MRARIFWVLVLFSLHSTTASDDHPEGLRSTLEDLVTNCENVPHDMLFDFLPRFEKGDVQYLCQKSTTKKGQLVNDGWYVSMYSKTYKMTVLSAAVMETVIKNKPPRGNWDDNKINYFVFPGFDRGHLLPYRYAKNGEQGRATMKISNAVPQDSAFNEGQWSQAEALVAEYFQACHDTSIVITGAVPGYFGVDGDEEPVFKMKRTTKNFGHELPLPGKDRGLETGMTIPTHMWTQFFCVKSTKPPKPKGQRTPWTPHDVTQMSKVSLIGLNYRSPIVRLYEEGNHETLIQMYRQSLKYSPGAMATVENNPGIGFSRPEPPAVFCKKGSTVNLKTFECDDDDAMQGAEVAEDTHFWDNINLNKIRGAWLLYMHHQHVVTSSESPITTIINAWKRLKTKIRPRADQKQTRKCRGRPVKKSGRKVHRKNGQRRKKRSVNGTSANEEKIITHTITIRDMDPNSDFELSTCTILETSADGQIMETHAYDFERNVFIEDGEVDSGSNLTATYTDEDGVEVPADEETAPKVIQDVAISISTSPLNGTTDTTSPQNGTTETTSPQNVSSYFFSVSDEDSSSDLELKDCRIWEKSEGEVIETHVYDFESNTLIEDRKVDSGSTLTATYTNEGGAEVEAEKKATEVETISIVLRPG